MTPDKAIEAVAAHADTHDEECRYPLSASYECSCTAKAAQAALPTLRRMAEERREAVEALRAAEEWMAEDGCDCGVDESGTCALCTARAFLRRVDEGGGDVE